MSYSLLITVKNRQTHLQHVLRAVPLATVQPEEIIIVHMNEPVYHISTPRVHEIRLDSSEPLPLAKARNTAASHATTNTLVFLDVDCIPDSRCFEILLKDLESVDISMVDPYYLRQPVSDTPLDFTVLADDSTPNPARNSITYGQSNAYAMFWSLGFAMTKENYKKHGGFDEAFIGYGGEDTDFAYTARHKGLQLGFSKARVYHQNHASYDPPLNWLSDITTNASIFYKKWGSWPMEGWLKKFVELGYITWEHDTLRVIKQPTTAEIERYRKS